MEITDFTDETVTVKEKKTKRVERKVKTKVKSKRRKNKDDRNIFEKAFDYVVDTFKSLVKTVVDFVTTVVTKVFTSSSLYDADIKLNEKIDEIMNTISERNEYLVKGEKDFMRGAKSMK